MRNQRIEKTAIQLLAFVMLATRAVAGPIDDLQPGQWYEFPNSHLRSVAPNPLPEGNLTGVTLAWGGGTFDSKRNRLMVWGGGHSDYSGNEMYAFDADTGAWTRLSNPSSSPKSQHTYDHLEYLPNQDMFFSAPGGGVWPSGFADTNAWLFNLATNTWSNAGQFTTVFVWPAMTTDYDPQSGKVIVIGNQQSATFDGGSQTWSFTDTGNNQILYLNGAFDTKRRKFVEVGGGRSFIFSVDANGLPGPRQTLSTTGPQNIVGCDGPGFEYDPVSDRLVGWCGSDRTTSVYTLNMDTKVWTQVSATNSVNPNTRDGPYNGTFGRFQYMPAYNAFILVDSVDGNVFAYRLTDGSGPPPPPTLTPSVSVTATPTSVTAGGSTNLNWTSENVSTCTASGGWSGTKATSGQQSAGPLSANTTFTLSCSGANGSASSSASVTVQAPPPPPPTPTPSVSVTATPTSVTAGGSTNLNWTSANVSTCTASGGWSGTKATSGQQSAGPLSANTTFTLSCSGANGSATGSASVTVQAPPPPPTPTPSVSVTATPTGVTAGGSTNLSWTSANVSTCAASGGWSGTKATSGQQSVGPLSANTTFTLSCSGANGSASSSASVTVQPATPTFTLSYDVPGGISGVALNGRTVTGMGRVYVTPESGITSLDYLLDGSFVNTEYLAPYELGGGSTYDFTALATGTHTISVLIRTAAGTQVTLAATISVTGGTGGGGTPANQPPATPMVAGFSDPVTLADTTIDISAPYSDPEGDGLLSSEWQIGRDAAFATKVLGRLVPGPIHTALNLTAGVLDPAETYWIRTRHKDDRGATSPWSEAVAFTSAAVRPGDADGNGVEDASQADGDANFNGVNDASEGICDLRDASNNVVGLEADAGQMQCYRAIGLSQTSVQPPAGTDLPYGLFSFRIDGLPINASNPARAMLRVHLPSRPAGAVKWYKFDAATNVLFELAGTVTFEGNAALVELVDGGIGDFDGVVNGVIVDPSGPLTITASGGTSGDGGAGTESSVGDDGGGSIGWLLPGLMAAAGLVRRRRIRARA